MNHSTATKQASMRKVNRAVGLFESTTGRLELPLLVVDKRHGFGFGKKSVVLLSACLFVCLTAALQSQHGRTPLLLLE